MDLDQTSPTFSWWSSQRMRGESCSRVWRSRVEQTMHWSQAWTLFLPSCSSILLWVEYCWPLTEGGSGCAAGNMKPRHQLSFNWADKTMPRQQIFGKRNSLLHQKNKASYVFSGGLLLHAPLCEIEIHDGNKSWLLSWPILSLNIWARAWADKTKDNAQTKQCPDSKYLAREIH